MAEFWGKVAEDVPALGARQRVFLAAGLAEVAPYAPGAIARVSAVLRADSVPEEEVRGLVSTMVYDQARVLVALGRPLFEAAKYAVSDDDKLALLRELCSLVEAQGDMEADRGEKLTRKGDRAAGLLNSVLRGGPGFCGDYSVSAKSICFELIDALRHRPPTPGQRELLDELVRAAVSPLKHQTWFDHEAMVFRVRLGLAGMDHPAREVRAGVIDGLKEALSDDGVPIPSRLVLWKEFAAAYECDFRMRKGGTEGANHEAMVEHLTWTHALLRRRDVGIAEFAAARGVWRAPHLREDNPELVELANKLEQLYAGNRLAKEFEPLLYDGASLAEWNEFRVRITRKGDELAVVGEEREIVGFVDRASQFEQGGRNIEHLCDVAWVMGAHAVTTETVRRFVYASLERPAHDRCVDFGVWAGAGWVVRVRESHARQTHVLVGDLLGKCVDDDRRATLLLQLYGSVPRPSYLGEFTLEERALLRDSRDLFVGTGKEIRFVAALAQAIDHDWLEVRGLVTDVLSKMPPDRIVGALRALVRSIHCLVLRLPNWPAPEDLVEWLLNELLALRGSHELGTDGRYALSAILGRLGKAPLRWLPGALARRHQQEEEHAGELGGRLWAVDLMARISQYVRQIDACNAGDVEVRDAVRSVLGYARGKGSVSYYLQQVMKDIDPEGLVVPELVQERLEHAESVKEVLTLSSVAGAYRVNSTSWRVILVAAIDVATRIGPGALQRVYSGDIDDRGTQSGYRSSEEIKAALDSALEEATGALTSEGDQRLIPIWERRLRAAERELAELREKEKEDLGE